MPMCTIAAVLRRQRFIFVEKDCGYYVKAAKAKSLIREVEMTKYFNGLGLATNILAYISKERDYLVTERLGGADCIAAKHLQQPEKLCDVLTEQLRKLHSTDYSKCPVQNHTERYLKTADTFYRDGNYNK